MSKRKTTDKSGLNQPRSKRQKLNNGIKDNNTNNSKQTLCSSEICNEETDTKHFVLNAHCYDNNNYNNSIPSIIEIKNHTISSIDSLNNNAYSLVECDKICSKINQRLKIYWNEDKQWYYGTIKDFKSSTNESLIVYDDGESEWLNLTKSGHETVEFLYDNNSNVNNNKNTNNNKNIISIGNKISSGKVIQTFSNGCIANINLKLDNRNNCGVTAIAFDNKYLNNILNNKNINNSNDIFKLLHLCQFDKTLKDYNNNNNKNNNNVRRLRSSNRNKKANDIEIKHNNEQKMNTNSNSNENENDNIPPWILIGCNTEMDPIIKMDTESHVNFIHSNESKYSKPKRCNGYNNNTITYNGKNSKKNIYNSNIILKNNNKITKKCNNKNIIDLKAIYPLEKIRQQNHNKKRTVIVIGAGISGLSCSRELMNFGYNVIVLEARNRAGGRILTDYTMGLDENHGCDVGGGWIHGVERNPLTRLVERLKLTLHSTSGTIQMYDYKGNKVNENLDEKVEKEFNELLDRISKENEQRYARIHGSNDENSNNNSKEKYKYKCSNNKSLGAVLNEYLNEKKKKKKITIEELNLWNWHFSNLEYSNASDLTNLSLTDWDQDDEYAFSGDHCLIQEGYGRIINGLKDGINIKYKNIVTKIDWSKDNVKVYAKKNMNVNEGIDRHNNNNNMNVGRTPESSAGSNVSESVSEKSVNSNMNVNVNGNNNVMNDSIGVQYDGIDGLNSIQLQKVGKDGNDIKDSVPIYAMVNNEKNDAYQFVKLKDVKGHCNYTSQSHELNEDIDISMSDSSDEENETENELMEYSADAVVVTLPLGILKAGDVEFEPSLPLWKRNAISGIGYGLLNKIFLKFPRVFWDISNDYVGYASSIHGEFYLFVNLVPVSGTPVLMSLISGSFALKLECQSDIEIVNYCMKILTNIFNNKTKNSKLKCTIPQPIDYYVTKWGKDKFSRGSYSFIASGANGDDYDKLSYSVKDKIYFAGEATIRKWPASVHGAYLSGIREARKIMNNHYIHSQENTSSKTRRGKRNNTCQNTHLIKAGLNEYPTDTIFKPIKDVTIRMSTRRNNANKYSSQNRAKALRNNLNKKSNNLNREESDEEEEDVSSMSDTSSITSCDSNNNNNNELEQYDKNELVCTLCGGNGYLSDDILYNKKKKKKKKINTNEKLIGPFILDKKGKDKGKTIENIYIHYGCGQWSPDIHNQNNVWYNVISCIKRSKYIKCCYCNEYGATVHCHNKYCLSSYHPECAHTTQYWNFNRPDEGQLFFCIKHRENMLALHVNELKSKISDLKKNQKNKLRQPRPPSIRK